MPDDYFGPQVAAAYDDHVADMFDASVVEPAVDLLARLAGDGAALEFGIGTGRVALPLTARGVPVSGIDLSVAMVEQMRAKPGGADVPVTIGDFATTRMAGEFSVAYLVFNTIGNLTTQDAQVDCFRNAARHLAPGGCFVVETFVPEVQRLSAGERVVPFSVTEEHLGFDEYDVPAQGLISHHFYRRADGRYERQSIPFRYVWPAELDLMARLAGMVLSARWSGWDRSPFTAASPSHVSVWKRES
jgi:SAM-dependent methyltransferase